MPQQLRRLSDKLFSAFQQACEQDDVEVAEIILHALELVLTREQGEAAKSERRTDTGPVVEAYGRLKALKSKRERERR